MYCVYVAVVAAGCLQRSLRATARRSRFAVRRAERRDSDEIVPVWNATWMFSVSRWVGQNRLLLERATRKFPCGIDGEITIEICQISASIPKGFHDAGLR